MTKEKIIIQIYERSIHNQGLDNLMLLWDNKIKNNLTKFAEYQSIIMLIYEIENLIGKIKQKAEYQNEYKMKIINKINGGPFFVKKNIFEREPPPVNAAYSQKNLSIFKEEDEKEDNNNENRLLFNRLNSSNQICNCRLFLNNFEEENKNNTENIQRSAKKSATIGVSSSCSFERDFDFIIEKKDNNYITKIRRSKQYLNFIDIDLFFQYIALGKKFYENEEGNKCLIEGFCLQYQCFTFAEVVVARVIKCFNFFYDKYLYNDGAIIEEKNEDEEDEKENNQKDNNTVPENNNTNNLKDENDNKVNDDNSNNNIKIKKIPYGLVDFMHTLISLHNTYFHNELSHNVIEKIYEFIKQLKEKNEIMEKYEEKIELIEIELKEYEASIKTFKPKQQITVEKKNENNYSSDDAGFNSEEEEPEIKKTFKKTATYTNEISFNSSKIKKEYNQNKIEVNPSKLDHLIEEGGKHSKSKTVYNKDDKKKKESNKKLEKEKPYQFDLMKYKTQDIALELTRISYALYSKIKIKEFLKAAFNGKDKYKTSPHLCQIINRFNALSFWATEEILAYDHSEKRAEIILQFIKICYTLKKLGNFDDCLSLYTGFYNSNINKLQKTWSHIPSSGMTILKELTTFLSFDDNYKNMRDEISKRIKEKSLFIPYLGYYTKRLIYLEELGPYIKKNTSLLNIEKVVEVHKIIKDFFQIKNVKSCGHTIHDENVKKELAVLQCLDPSNEEFLADTARLLEPKFLLSNKKLNLKRRTKTDINFLSNMNKYNIL